MGKKKRTVAPEPDADGYINTGIYSEFVGDRESHPEEFELNERFGARSIFETVDELCARMAKRLEEVLNERKRQIPESEWARDECVSDAVDALLMLNTLNFASRELQVPDQTIHLLVQLGELYERAQVRLIEPLALSGRARVEHAEHMRAARSAALITQKQEKREDAQ